MKKLFNLLVVLFTGMCIVSASPSLDGRAVVAEKGTLPSGLFAKTVGYLPGDSISVTNPANGQIVDILVIGSLDPSEGVAVLLSPEAASTLNIKKNSNMLVKLTKRTGELDENSIGSCILTQSAPQEFLENDSTETSEVEETVEEEPAAEDETIESEQEEDAEYEEDVEEDIPADEYDEEDLIEDDSAAPEETEEVETEEVEEESVIEDDYVAPEEESIDEEELPEEYEEEKPVIEDNYVAPEEESIEEEELPPEEVIEEEELPPEAEEEETENVEEEAPEEEEEVEETSVPKTAFAPDSESIEEEELPEEPEQVEETEEVVEEVEEAEEDDFEAIILVPAEDNPPAEETEVIEKEVEKIVEIEKTSYLEETKSESTEKVTEKISDKSSEKVSSNVKVITSLEKDRYYIQIAAYKNIDNVNEVSSKYGKKYPVVVEKRGDINVVMIGPLTMDEYGTVLQRFKAFGFKDAFVKKGK